MILNSLRLDNIPTASCIGLRRMVVTCAIVLFALGVASQKVIAQQPQVTGQWVTLSYPMPINPIHVGLLHTGKVLIVAGSENNPNEHKLKISKAAVWDLGAGKIGNGTITRTKDLTWDVFCNGWAFFPDGRCLVIGGTTSYAPFSGDARTTVFDPITQKFSQLQYMAHGRWYATGIVLANGRIMAFSGEDETGTTNKQVEFYTVGSGWSSPLTAPFFPSLYPWMHVLPDGRVFNSGSSPNSNIFNPNSPNPTWILNYAKTTTGLDRTYGNSVLLPLLPENNYAARIMILGGGIVKNATATTEMIDFSKSTPAWIRMGDMPSGARVEGNSVLLPSGKLLVQGGSKINQDATTATLGSDLFDPANGTWSSPKAGGAGFAKFARMYHSVALLLPDATVATAGSNPNTNTWDNHIEIYSPAYLFDATGKLAPRPVVTSGPTAIGYNSVPFQVQTPDALNIKSVVLIKPGSDTHAYDMEQRLLGLTFTAASGVLTINSPPNSNLAPPGYYLLFVLNQAGVPSVGKFVQVSQNPKDLPPKGTITAPAGDVTLNAGQAVNFTGTATDADGSVKTYSWFFPEGSPETSTVPIPGLVTFSTPGTYVASLTAVDDKGVNDPSPPTRTVTVKGPASGQPPVANDDGGFVTTVGKPVTILASQLLANDTDPNGFTLSILSVTTLANANGTVFLNNVTPKSVTFTPTAGYTGPASFAYTITNGRTTNGTASATVSLTVNAATSLSLFAANSTPGTITDSDSNSVELGVRFQSSVAGKITAIRFYKGPNNTGTHMAHLWSSAGASLATATFSAETASGWQQVNLAAPVAINANTVYVASYHATKGSYSANSNYFATARVSGSLTAPAGANGVYMYGTSSIFPNSTFGSTNYWVDVVFVPN